MQSILAAILGLLVAAIYADDNGSISTSAQSDSPPDWANNNALQLNLSSDPIQYTVVPVLPNAGTNGSNSSGIQTKTININGVMIATDVSNFNKITSPNDVAYISCDGSSNTFISTNELLNDVVNANPKAIVLYSLAATWCSLDFTNPPAFSNIFSMADSGEAQGVLNSLNGTANGRVVNVSITGNASSTDSNNSGGGTSNSTVAMSILYTITALITLLFLVIIATGAVRAHRYPERYGPRRALGGRPRQSRAKGLARAVLETLPIVKFNNNQEPIKPDPDLELDAATTDGRDARTQRSSSILTQEVPQHEVATATPATAAAAASDIASPPPVVNVGCSICTEDFTEGEDMRVLPCNHTFHPNCIDPWLINVSGTCPLCRLDLRPEAETNEGDIGMATALNRGPGDRTSTLPPPLALEGEDGEGGHPHHRHRISRFFDVNRLRQATAEEQIEALRQMRSTRQTDAEAHEAGAAHDTERERGQRAHLTAKLKEKFRIRTRARSPEREQD
ncbi:ring finger domain-containing protein [Trichoderma breve]|uniref:RING-type E3 ubiquitin transferase n=1 Tax=Trichoderma breve TaxID=2034170 RepID=A0A9W9E4U9_9HYPO|nr:ring finger domain-containing protein [Trichoderma breve]KAJ4859098.1 ring finger domain-containing protein [Trichoderma breve]